MKHDHPPLDEIFTAAAGLVGDDREAYLDHACAGDAALRAEAQKLLAAQSRAEQFLERAPGLPLVTGDDESVSDQVGAVIGPYKLLQQIGEGGFGVVYMAEQKKPVRRKVALKIVKPGMDTKEVIARFEAERQALALMDHPNIAKVLDAGATESGRPYFVMELVHGVPITEFCADQKLSTRERLDLFVNVCRAVQHAHQKGIIHRDLKPTNILITMDDDRPLPKVIDFGILKALSQQLTEKTLFTAYGQMVGTPIYMSPEQAQLSAHDVDTRSDVYSLGVLLYELLTDSTPFDKETLLDSGLDEMRRMIREVDPPRPSNRVSTLSAERLSTVSARRKTDQRQLAISLRRELDWIVMRAMEKDRNRRYESASAIAADIVSYLNDEPVEACPPSVGYRFSKFARRKRTALLTTMLVAMSLITGAGISFWQAVRATKAERLAEQRLHVEKRARTLADFRRLTSGANVHLMMTGLWPDYINFSENRVIQTQNRMIEILETLMAESPNDPRLMSDLSASYATLGLYLAAHGEVDKAIAEIERALELSDKAMSYENTPRDWEVGKHLTMCIARILKKANRVEEALRYSGLLDLTFGPGGELLVGSRQLDCVLQFDARTRRYVRVFAEGGGLSSPNGMVFGPDGNLYVCSEFGDSVLRYDGVTGEFMDVFVSNVRQPVALVFGPDGNLYVNSWPAHCIVRYKGATAEFIDVFVQPESGGLNHPEGLAFGPDGNLFVASTGTDAVLRYDGESGDFIGTFTSLAGLHPTDLKFGTNHRLYVSGGHRSRSTALFCFDATTGEYMWSAGRGNVGMAIALAPGGDLYVVQNNPDDVLIFNGEAGERMGSLVLSTDAITKRNSDND